LQRGPAVRRQVVSVQDRAKGQHGSLPRMMVWRRRKSRKCKVESEKWYNSPPLFTFYVLLFTFHFSLSTFHFLLFTFYFSLSTFHFPLDSCYKIASPVSSCPAHLRQHLPRQQLHALAGQVVRQGAHLAAGQHHAAAQLLLVALELLPHRRRTADDSEHAL